MARFPPGPRSPLGRAGMRSASWRKILICGLMLLVSASFVAFRFGWGSASSGGRSLPGELLQTSPLHQQAHAIPHENVVRGPRKAGQRPADKTRNLIDEDSLELSVSRKRDGKKAHSAARKPTLRPTLEGKDIVAFEHKQAALQKKRPKRRPRKSEPKHVAATSDNQQGVSDESSKAVAHKVMRKGSVRKNSKPSGETSVQSNKDEGEGLVRFSNADSKPIVPVATEPPQEDASLPQGTYLDSCASCTLRGSSSPHIKTLRCTCCLIDGHNCAWNASLVHDVRTCTEVDNVEGQLECHAGLPSGSFAKSCKDCTGNASYVACGCCFHSDGSCKATKPLHVPRDCGLVDNRKGELVCANKSLPEGPFAKTCSNCTYSPQSKMLSCDCCNMVSHNGLLSETKCVPTSPLEISKECNDVFNNHGRLQCRGQLPPGGYLEDCTDCTVSEVQQSTDLKPVEGIPEQYRDTNPVLKLTCGCCSYGSQHHPGCRPSVSLLIHKQWCHNVNVNYGFLRCTDQRAGTSPKWPGSYSDSCILCNSTLTPENSTKMSCFCLDASNTYQPASSVILKPGCDVVENVRGALTCHAAPSLYHNHYRFRHTVSAAKLNPALNVIVNRLNAGENAAKDTVEGEESWQAFLAATRQMPVGLFAGKFANSKGIVILGGGSTYFISAWVDILMIRSQNCTLPIELWIDDVPEEKLPPSVMDTLEKTLGVTVRVLDMLQPVDAANGFTHSKKFVLKPAAIVFSRFQHVIFLDADNIPLKNLEMLFELPEYQSTGALYWPDFPAMKPAAEIWKELPVSPFMGPQAESGQMVIDKGRHWQPLMLALYFNVHADWYYPKISFGDKDTYQTAWYVLEHGFTMVHWPVSSVGYGTGCSFNEASGQTPDRYRGHTMLHRLPDGRPLFLHKNLRKWTSSIESVPDKLPSVNSPASWKSRAWQTVATCELNPGLSITKWFSRTNTISSQLCNNLWFFERMSASIDLDLSLLMRYQCSPSVKSVKIVEKPFLEFIGFDVESLLLSSYRAVLSHPGYKEFMGSQHANPNSHHYGFCKKCKLTKTSCPDCSQGSYLWEYKCNCKSPLHTQVQEELSMYYKGKQFCEHGMVRYVNHTLVCERIALGEMWSGHMEYLR